MHRLSQLPIRRLSLVALVAQSLAALLLVAPARGAEVDKFLPDDTEIVAVVNIRQILDSALVQKYGIEAMKKDLKSNDEAQKVLEALGFDPFKDIDSVTVAVPAGDDVNKWLMIAHGKYDLAKFRAAGAQAVKDHADIVKVTKAGAHTVYEVSPPGQPQSFYVGLVNKSTIVMAGTKEYVSESFDRAAGKKTGTPGKAIQALIEKADAKQSIWMAAEGKALLKGQVAGNEEAKAFLEKVKSLTGGVTVSDDVKVHFVLHATSPANAKEINEKIEQGLMQAKGLLTFIVAQNKQLQPVLSFVETLKIETKGSQVTVKGEVSKDVIEKAVQNK